MTLRMFLAALEPAFQIPHVRDVLAPGADDDEEGQAVGIAWAFDRLEPLEALDRDIFPQTDPTTLGELEALPALDPVDLAGLREMAEQLASLMHELEAEEA